MTLTSQLGHHHRYTSSKTARARSSDVIRSCVIYTSHGHLLAGVGGQVEDADAEERDEDARDDELVEMETQGMMRLTV